MAQAETITLASTVGADYLASPPCERINLGLPLMMPAAFMDAAWAA